MSILSSSMSPSLLLVFFFSWHWVDLWPKGSKQDWREGARQGRRAGGRSEENWKEGGRKHERKELENALGMGAKQRGGYGETKTPEYEAMIWMLLLSTRDKRVERTDVANNGREWMGESLLTWPRGALTYLTLSPTLCHFLRQVPTQTLTW